MSSTAQSPLQRLSALRQSVWVDFLSREEIRGGKLQSLIDNDAVVGATSNPTIFQKAMTAGDAYDEQLHELPSSRDVTGIFWALAEQDVREACDLFRPVFDTDGRDGLGRARAEPLEISDLQRESADAGGRDPVGERTGELRQEVGSERGAGGHRSGERDRRSLPHDERPRPLRTG